MTSSATIRIDIRHADTADEAVLKDWIERIADHWIVGCSRLDIEAKVMSVSSVTIEFPQTSLETEAAAT